MRKAIVLLLCGLVAASAAGCTAEEPGTPPATEAGQAKQPYDIILGEKVGLIEYAAQRIRNKCLADAGYPQNLNTMAAKPENPFAFITVSARDFGPTSEEEARRMGFGADTMAAPARVVSNDPNYNTNLDRCEKQAWEKFGPEARKTHESYNDLVNVLADYRRDVDQEMPKDLPAKVFDCMAKRGYTAPDREAFLKTPNHRLFGVKYGALDGGAEDAWAPSRKPGTIEIGPAIPARHYTPTPQESELAVAWFGCNSETKRVEAWLAAVAKVQQRNVEKNQTWIDELNPKIEELARKAAELAGVS